MATANRRQSTENERRFGAYERAGEREFQRALSAVYRAIEALGREAERSLLIVG
jgi:hypothetical protein